MQTTPVKPEAGNAKEAANKHEMQKLQDDLRNAMAVIEEMKLEAARERAAFASERAARIREFGTERAVRVQLEEEAESWKHQEAEPWKQQ